MWEFKISDFRYRVFSCLVQIVRVWAVSFRARFGDGRVAIGQRLKGCLFDFQLDEHTFVSAI